MGYTLEERIQRFLELAEAAASDGRLRQAKLFRRMALDLTPLKG